MVKFDLSFFIFILCIYECLSIMTVSWHNKIIKNKKANGIYLIIAIINIIYMFIMILLLFTNKWYIGLLMFIISILQEKAAKLNDETSMIILSLMSLFILITFFI